MNFKKIITITLSLLLFISTFAGCRKISSDMSSGNTSDISSTVYGVVDIVDNSENTDSQASSEESTSSDNTQSDATISATDTSSEDTYVIVDIGDGDDSEDDPPTYIETTPDTSTGASNSTEKITYVRSPNVLGKVKTVAIAAGQSVYYKIDRVSNKQLTINSPNAYVIYDGVTYSAQNGVVSFLVETDLLASDQILFEIGNNGSTTEQFTISFTSLAGSMDNPKELTAFNEKISTTLEKGNDQGYFYKCTADKGGKIKFYLLSGTTDGILIVTNNSNSAQRSTDISDELKTDSTGSYVYLDVNKGDKIIINIGAKEKDGVKYPAATIEWMAKYE